MKSYTLKNGHILLVPKDAKTICIPGNLDNLGTDATEYVKRFREIANTIEGYIDAMEGK